MMIGNKARSATRDLDFPFARLADIGPDLFLVHRANGMVIHAGANAERILSAPSGDLAGHAFFEMIHVQDRVSVIKCVADCLEQGRLKKVQFRLAPDNAKPVERWFEMRCEPAPGLLVEGEGMLALSVVRDISERRALEQALRNEHEKAESANIAKSRFLANMSHELRTPLNAILGFSELMQSDAMKNMPPERSGEYVGLIHNSATHLLNVLNDILDMSKIEAGKYQIVTEPFDIGATLRASAAMLRGQADKKGIEIVIGDFDGLPEINADERAVKQIMINLVANAVKFTDEGGRVWIGARRNGRNIVIDVSDNGIGISPEHLGSLGMPFYQADSQYDRKYEGTGLGLSVVCGLVDLHEGKVRFESEKGVGTRVFVTLPIARKESRPVPACEAVEVVRLHSEKDKGNGVAEAGGKFQQAAQ